jgi:hypothetical protein
MDQRMTGSEESSFDDSCQYCVYCENNVSPNMHMCYTCAEAYENEEEAMNEEMRQGTLETMILCAILLDIEEFEIT